MYVIEFSGDTVGLVVRGKRGEGHHPWDLQTHADCIKSDGECVGFFADQSGETPYMPVGNLILTYPGFDMRQQSGYAGQNMHGVVYDMTLLLAHRPQYVDLSVALRDKQVSTLLLLRVGEKKAKKFDRSWKRRKKNPPAFWFAEDNCASRSADSFVEAGIIEDSMDWVWDSPDNLYHKLKDAYPDDHEVYWGYMGFESAEHGGYNVRIVPA